MGGLACRRAEGLTGRGTAVVGRLWLCGGGTSRASDGRRSAMPPEDATRRRPRSAVRGMAMAGDGERSLSLLGDRSLRFRERDAMGGRGALPRALPGRVRMTGGSWMSTHAQ
jgi:hypothetical protein